MLLTEICTNQICELFISQVTDAEIETRVVLCQSYGECTVIKIVRAGKR